MHGVRTTAVSAPFDVPPMATHFSPTFRSPVRARVRGRVLQGIIREIDCSDLVPVHVLCHLYTLSLLNWLLKYVLGLLLEGETKIKMKIDGKG